MTRRKIRKKKSPSVLINPQYPLCFNKLNFVQDIFLASYCTTYIIPDPFFLSHFKELTYIQDTCLAKQRDREIKCHLGDFVHKAIQVMFKTK